MAATGKQETPVTHARTTTANQKTPAQLRVDTAPLLQGRTQPAALPAPDNTGPGTDPKQLNHHNPRLPFPRSHIIGLPDGHLKDACGAAARPGCARSLTRPPARHGHGSYR